MPQRWAIWLSIEGDLRFASHRDMMRSVERLAVRAGLRLRYTQGFNPHPILSLIPPRPVGVASRDDMLVIALDEPTTSVEIVSDLQNASPPAGLTVIGASELEGKASPQPHASHYDMTLDDATRRDAVASRTAELAEAQCWPVERAVKAKGGRGRRREASFATKSVDLRPRVEQLVVTGNRLSFILPAAATGSAKPGEVLALCGLDERTDLASLVRTEVDYRLGSDQTDFRAGELKQT